MGSANDRVGASRLSGPGSGLQNDVSINEIACALVSALNQIHEPQCQQIFGPHLALINVQSFKRFGDPGQVGG